MDSRADARARECAHSWRSCSCRRHRRRRTWLTRGGLHGPRGFRTTLTVAESIPRPTQVTPRLARASRLRSPTWATIPAQVRPPPRSPSMRSLPGLVTRRWMACHSMAKDRGGLVCWREQLWTICSTPRERRSERPIPRWVIHPTPLRALGVAAHPANRNNSFLLFSRVEGHHRPRARR